MVGLDMIYPPAKDWTEKMVRAFDAPSGATAALIHSRMFSATIEGFNDRSRIMIHRNHQPLLSLAIGS